MIEERSPRPRRSVFVATSVDGFIARPDGGLDWLDGMHVDGEDFGYATFMAAVDVVVMGRNTYDAVIGFDEWPFQGKRAVVLTHRPTAPRHEEEFFTGSIEGLVEKLGQEGAERIYVDGGSVIRQCVAAGLVDDITISIIPILLGKGIPLFEHGPEVGLVLEESRSWSSNGLVQVRYRVDR